MSDKLISISKFLNEIEAVEAQGALEEAGIKSMITGQNASNVFGGMVNVFDVELMIKEDDLEAATAVLEKMQGREKPSEEQ